jgi:hypothetical protein
MRASYPRFVWGCQAAQGTRKRLKHHWEMAVLHSGIIEAFIRDGNLAPPDDFH